MTNTLRYLLAATLLAATMLPMRHAAASFDEFADDFSPTNFEVLARFLVLTIKGELEIELHDLEGEGGPGNDSPTDTRTLGTRSPFVEIDSFWLALRVGFSEGIGVYSFLDFSTRGAAVGSVFFDLRRRAPHWLEHHVEVGYNTPIVKIDRRTERYPLVATAFWRNPELHAAYEATFFVNEAVRFEVGASIAMMRPLGFSSIQESTAQPGTLNILSAQPAAVFSGNGPVGGGRARASVYGASLEVFGFIGRLAAQSGTDILRSGFSTYRELPGYPSDADGFGPYHWFGGRVGYDDFGVHALFEAIVAKEDLLERWGAWGQLSYEIRPFGREATLFHTFEPLIRYEIYRVIDGAKALPSGRALRSPAPIDAVAWDHDILTLALITTVYRDFVRLRVEYYWVSEDNGVPELGIDDAPFRNNELMIQGELRF